MAARNWHFLRATSVVPVFVPLLEFSQSYLDEALVFMLVALLAILILNEILRLLTGGIGRKTLWPPLLLVAFTTVALLLIKFTSLPR